MCSTVPKVLEWVRQMGYQGDVPETLDRVVTNSTSVIWEQLIQNTIPRQEVYLMRKNLIVNRLQKKQMIGQNDFLCPILEIELYQKREKHEATKEILKASVAEKEKKADSLARDNKLKFSFIEKSKIKGKANQERAFLLKNKCLMLENEIQEVEDYICTANNITPVEAEENCNTKEISEVLEECVKKLENNVTTLPSLCVQTPKKSLSQISYRGLNDKVNKLQCNNIFSSNSQAKVNRESLGLLPESYFERNSFIASDLGTQFQDHDLFEEIDVDTFSIMKQCTSTGQNMKPTEEMFAKIFKDSTICQKLSELLHQHDRTLMWNLFQTLNVNLHQSVFNKLFPFHENKKIGYKSVNQDDIFKFQALHVQNELQIMKTNAIIRQLSLQIENKREHIKTTLEQSFLTHEKVDTIINILNLHLQDVALDASITTLKKELHSAKSVECSNELQIISTKLLNIKENISAKITSINSYLKLSGEVLASIKHTCEESTSCVRKLGRFVDDMAWSAPLNQNLCSHEVKMFKHFPLELNRMCTYTNPSVHYRDIYTEVTPYNVEFNTDTLYILNEILEDPLSPPEIILLNLLKSKIKLRFLKQMENFNELMLINKYSFEDLKKQESYLEFAVDRLISLNNSQTVKKTLSISNLSKEAFDIWTKMPFKNFISSDRKVDGQLYTFYEKKICEFYNNL